MLRGGKELRVLGFRYLARTELERIHPNTMHGPFIILAHVTAHQEPARGNLYHARGGEFPTHVNISRALVSLLRLHVAFGSADLQKGDKRRAPPREARGKTTSRCKCKDPFRLAQLQGRQ